MKRSLLVQTLLDMATGSGGAKLEALVVDAAGTFDAGSGKGYNPVTVPSGSINVLGEKSVVSNNSVVVTPKAQIVGGWLNSGDTGGLGVSVTADELTSGELEITSNGTFDVSNYKTVKVSGVMNKTEILNIDFTDVGGVGAHVLGTYPVIPTGSYGEYDGYIAELTITSATGNGWVSFSVGTAINSESNLALNIPGVIRYTDPKNKPVHSVFLCNMNGYVKQGVSYSTTGSSNTKVDLSNSTLAYLYISTNITISGKARLIGFNF